ncbi:hypothetical protein FB451DRAFT_1493928 [Mycena latifolia]|nr:hypothetical protein FB451DRAFT_1493928 [Mycena latifolia]
MPHQPTVTDIRLDNTIACLTGTITVLDELSDAVGTPFLPAISSATISLIKAVQDIKKNKEDCIQLMENIYPLLCAIVNLHIKSETRGNLPPATLDHIGKFTEYDKPPMGIIPDNLFRTLHQIHAFVQAQQDGNKIKDLFRHRVQLAFEVFQIETGIPVLERIPQMQEEMDRMQKEALELISTLSDGSMSDGCSSIYKGAVQTPFQWYQPSQRYSTGRDSELKEVMEALQQRSPRIAILGPGGMGKTSLAKAALHHPDIAKKYERCYFITMRGAERPAKVQWTRPFLAPLKPLSDLAARDTFFAIAEDFHDMTEVDEVLALTDNMPLAADLIAHAVGSERSCSNVLARWQTEKTSLLSAGNDRRSNLDISITGLTVKSTHDHCKLSINDIMTCKATLLATSVAYNDDQRRLKSLVPIREHMECLHPSSPLLTYQLQTYFHQFLDLHQKYPRIVTTWILDDSSGVPNLRNIGTSHRTQTGFIPLKSNIGNLRRLLVRGLHQANPNLAETIDCTLSLNFFTRLAEYEDNAHEILMRRIPALLPQNCDPVLQYLKGQATAFHYLGEMKYAIGEYPAAQLYAEAFYKLSESARDLFAQAAALQILASCRRALGDHQNSVFLCQRAIKFLELGGITSGRAYDVLMLDQAEAHVLKSEYAEARRIHTQIVPDTTNQTAAKYAWGLLSIAQLDIITGANTQDVYLNLHKAKELFNSKGFMHPVKYCDLRLAELHLREGETLTAQGIFQTCFNSSWGNDAQAVLLCMKGLANVSSWPTSDFNQATRWPIIYLGYAKQLANKCAVYEALQLLGDVVQAQGDSVTSMTLYTLALEGFTCMDIHRSRAECMLRLADLANSQGDTSKAIELWTLARPLFERSSQVKQVSQVDERLATVTQTALEEQTETLRTY